MIKNKKTLALIPARGGSKRLPGKNILDLAGYPVIAWTIKAALSVMQIDRVVVSTDNDEIMAVSKYYGADLPFIRPKEIANDKATSFSVVLHALDKLKELGDNYEYVILLQPTSPLRTTQHIEESIRKLIKMQCDAVVSIVECDHSPLWSNTISHDLDMSNFISEDVKNKRSQDLDKYYRVNGAIYLCKVERLLEEKTFFLKDKIYGYIMERESSVDIDTLFDLNLAKLLMKGTI